MVRAEGEVSERRPCAERLAARSRGGAAASVRGAAEADYRIIGSPRGKAQAEPPFSYFPVVRSLGLTAGPEQTECRIRNFVSATGPGLFAQVPFEQMDVLHAHVGTTDVRRQSSKFVPDRRQTNKETEMQVRAVKRQSAEVLAANELRQQITSGDILPGTRLVEHTLAEQLAVSRGTLRIALHQLTKEGLIVQTPYTGWAVTTIASEDLWELYTLRAGLESLAARLACERLDEEGTRTLEASYSALVTACARGRYPNIAEKDFDLHKQIISLAKNRRLIEHYTLVEQQIRIFVATTYHLVSAPTSVIEHHEPIVRAILERRTAAAMELISEHAISEGEKLHRYLIAQDGAENASS